MSDIKLASDILSAEVRTLRREEAELRELKSTLEQSRAALELEEKQLELHRRTAMQEFQAWERAQNEQLLRDRRDFDDDAAAVEARLVAEGPVPDSASLLEILTQIREKRPACEASKRRKLREAEAEAARLGRELERVVAERTETAAVARALRTRTRESETALRAEISELEARKDALVRAKKRTRSEFQRPYDRADVSESSQSLPPSATPVLSTSGALPVASAEPWRTPELISPIPSADAFAATVSEEIRRYGPAILTLSLPAPAPQTGQTARRDVPLQHGATASLFSNGTRRMALPSGAINVFFANGDIRRILPDSSVLYLYVATRTLVYRPGSEPGRRLVIFPDGQRETHCGEGRRTVSYPDGAVRWLWPDGHSRVRYADGEVTELSPE